MEQNALKALEILAEWSKWIVSIEVALITAIGAAFISGNVYINYSCSSGIEISLIALSILFFVISICCASLLLYALPGIMQRLPPPNGQDVLMMGTFNGGGIILAVFAQFEFLAFVVGLGLLAVWIVCQMNDKYYPNV